MRWLPALTRRFHAWVARRAPRGRAVRLRHGSIYILPTGAGMGLLLVAALLWLLGTNYQNNLILATAFFLLSLMLISAVWAFRNLSGLTLSIGRTQNAFAGESAEFGVRLQAVPGTGHQGLRLGWQPGGWRELDLPRGGERELMLPHRSRRRGWLTPGPLRLESVYPLGLFRAWAWAHPEGRALVYPAPRPCERPPRALTQRERGERLSPDSQEEFRGFRRYRPGAPLAHVAWKIYARGQGLWIKDYTGYESEQVWLDWDALPGLDEESRLSRLCYWVIAYGKTTAEYGLRLPQERLGMSRGASHQRRALRMLALHGMPGREPESGAEKGPEKEPEVSP